MDIRLVSVLDPIQVRLKMTYGIPINVIKPNEASTLPSLAKEPRN